MKNSNIIKSFIFLAITFLVYAVKLQADSFIQPIHSFNEVNFNDIQPNTLVVFDVDDTLIQPIDSYVFNEHSAQGKTFRNKLIQEHPEVQNWDELSAIVLQEAERPLIEPIIIQKVHELKQRGIPVIACTGMNTGPHGPLPSLEEWRYEHLKSLGFQGSYDNLIFKNKGFKRNPGFYKGVLSTDLEDKGPILMVFLDQLNLKPKVIEMFDDHLPYLESVQKECKKQGISFHGYHYKNSRSIPWDEALIQFQADYLIKHKEWLSDEEGRHLMACFLKVNHQKFEALKQAEWK